MADGHAPSPCPLALFVSQAGEAKRHYQLSGFFSQSVLPGLHSERKIKEIEGKHRQSERWKEKEAREGMSSACGSGNQLECSPVPCCLHAAEPRGGCCL